MPRYIDTAVLTNPQSYDKSGSCNLGPTWLSLSIMFHDTHLSETTLYIIPMSHSFISFIFTFINHHSVFVA